METLRHLLGIEQQFLMNAVLACVLGSVACGVVGTYVTARRISYIAGSIAHCTLGGMGLAAYLSYKLSLPWLGPYTGAVAAALVGALAIGLVSLYAHRREDSIIGAVWAVGMALGVLFIELTPGYNQQLMSYLFGNVLFVATGDLWRMLILDVILVASSVLLYGKLLAICFDEEFARLRGVWVGSYYLILLGLTAITVVALTKVVGVVMAIALLTLPPSAASLFARRLWQMMLLATAFALVFTLAGLWLSWRFDVSSGSLIVILAGAAYAALMGGRALFRPRAPKPEQRAS